MLHRRRRREGEKGQIIVLFAIVLVGILAFTALVVDIGLLRNTRQSLANALDAGALGGGTLLPVDGTQAGAVAQVLTQLNKEIAASYPGIQPNPYCNINDPITRPAGHVLYCGGRVEFRCLVGVNNGLPYISRDVPATCDPHNALGHNPPVPADFIGAGATRSSMCDPSRGDRCNLLLVTGSITNNFTFGRAVGVNQGSTGTIVSAACNGPCGEPPFAPLDVVLIIDRTGSMAGEEANLRAAANTVLTTYNPAVQHLALGMLGPSSIVPANACTGSPAGVHGKALDWLSQPAQPYPRAAGGIIRLSGNATSNPIDTSSGNTGNGGTASDLRASSVNASVTNTTIVGLYGTDENTSMTAQDSMVERFDISNNNGNGPTLMGATLADPVAGATADRDADAVIGAQWAAQQVIVKPSGGSSPAFQQATEDNNSQNGANSIQIDRPSNSGNINNQILIASIAVDGGSNVTVNPPNGWNLIRRTDNGTNMSVLSYYKVAGGSEPGSYTWGLAYPPVPPVVQEYGTDSDPLGPDIAKWIVVGMTGTGGGEVITESYSNNLVLNPNTQIAKAIACFDLSGTGTNLATPFDMARTYLQAHGRPGVKQGIIFETDGDPNYNQTQDQSNYTCAESVAAANRAKAAKIEIFTIGFGVESLNCPDGGNTVVNHLGSIATGPILGGGSNCNANGNENRDGDHFFCKPTGTDLSAVFQAAAVQLAGIRSHLVQVYPAPFVTNVASPASVGQNVTVSGSGFTGATRVTFGGVNATSYSVNSDTSITARVPGGSGTVDVQVTTPGGTSPIDPGDRFTYN